MKTLKKAVAFTLITWAAFVATALMLENSLVFKPMPDWQDHPARHGLDASPIHVPTPDGELLRGWQFRATGQKTGQTIIWYHGNAGNVSTRLASAARLVSETNANLVLVDYRTYGRSTGTHVNERTLYVDALAIFDFVTASGVSPDAITLFGYSLGAAAAIETALQRLPGRIVLGGAFTSIPNLARRSYWYVPFPRLLTRTKMDNLSKIAHVKAPLLLVHGAQDTIIPAAHAEALHKAAPDYTEIRIFLGARHHLTDLEAIPAYWNAWRRHLNSSIWLETQDFDRISPCLPAGLRTLGQYKFCLLSEPNNRRFREELR